MGKYGKLEKDVIGYLLAKIGCSHPFRVSRLLAIAEQVSLEKRADRLTTLRYIKGPGVFYVEGLKEILESDNCFRRKEGDPRKGIRGCIEYVCETPILPADVKDVIDYVIHEYSRLDDSELNRIAYALDIIS